MRIVLLMLVFCGFAAIAGDPKFPVSAIPDELKKNADVVFREDQMTFTISSKSRASLHVYEVVTIFNDKGRRYATKVIGYDKLSKISSFKAVAYDANGNVLKKLKSSEIHDQSAFDGFSLYSDNRLKAAELTQGTYPYTVEFEYEVEYKYLFMIPGYVLLPEERMSVQHSSYELIYPKELKPRFKTLNLEKEPTITLMKDGSEATRWEFENVMPVKFEPNGPPHADLVSSIMVAPTTFEFDGYLGSMNSWDEFGIWISSLNKGRNELTEETKQKVLQLTAGKKTTEEKVKAIYEYMQNKTRYVSIQLGIGGFQPFEASVVDQTGYGDCKALSNYMVSMLEVAGIKAHYALIRAGRGAPEMKEEFPSSQFNHAVAAVPNGKDTIWLECTSQISPFGYAGTFTGDREALIITDKGAQVVKTTSYPEELNTQNRSADVYVTLTGDAKAKIKTIYSGLQYENDNLDGILNNQYDLQKKWVMNTTDIPSFDVNSFKFENKKNKIPSAVVSLDLSLRKLASVSGKRLMLSPNLMNRSKFIPEKLEKRKTEIIEDFGYIDNDTIRYHVPDEIYPEVLPQPVKISSRFGEYESTYTLDQGLIVYTRKLKINKGRFPANTYQEFVDFYKSVNRADNAKLVFLTKT
jgi:transglutaminase-like putative cysteine protease